MRLFALKQYIMALESIQNITDQQRVVVIDYNPKVPFNNSCTICEHILISNDVISPLTTLAVPGFGAMYRLIGDGIHSPTFDGFKKSSGSGTYNPTLGILNLVTFIFDGVDYWYTINQETVL